MGSCRDLRICCCIWSISYGVYVRSTFIIVFRRLTLRFRIILVVIILQTNFFENNFHATLPTKSASDSQLHMIVYLQVAIISQALIFVTRSHGFCFMERPSYALMGAFCIAQLVSSIIAAFADWGFTKIHSISGAWIGIVWVWVCDGYLRIYRSHADLSSNRTSSGSCHSTSSSSQ